MADLSDFDADLMDGDGYPTEEALDLIPRWTSTPRELVEHVLDPIFAAYGTINATETVDDFDRPVMDVRVATGGWSGCESAISALKKGMFWTAWWKFSQRGGGYRFKIPVSQWVEPMIDWTPVLEAASEPEVIATTYVQQILSGGQWRDCGAEDTAENALSLATMASTTDGDTRVVVRRVTEKVLQPPLPRVVS